MRWSPEYESRRQRRRGMNLLFIGDVVGRPGRHALAQVLPGLQREYEAEFTVVNGENAAAGFGVTRKVLTELYAAGADCVTTGNHVWAKKEVESFIEDEVRLLRPDNYPRGVPGHGTGLFRTAAGVPVAAANVLGRVFMQPLECPFAWADEVLPRLRREADVVIVDFHAEATSEKQAFARVCDGRASAVIGTHTHVQTADERVLPRGTAFIADCGMTGPVDSIIGTEVEPILRRFRTQMPTKFEIAKGPVEVCGVTIDIDESTGRARTITRLRRRVD